MAFNFLAGPRTVNNSKGLLEIDPSIIHQQTTGIVSSRFKESFHERGPRGAPHDYQPRGGHARGGYTQGAQSWSYGRGANGGYEPEGGRGGYGRGFAGRGYGRGINVTGYGRGAPYGDYPYSQVDAYGASAYGYQDVYSPDPQWEHRDYYSPHPHPNYPGMFPRNPGYDTPRSHYRGRGGPNFGRGRGTFDAQYHEAEFKEKQRNYSNQQHHYGSSESIHSSKGGKQLEESPPKKGKFR